MNVEQAREVFHAAHESLLAMTEQLQMPQYLYARLWQYLSSYIKLVHLCLWILFMWYQKMTVSCMFDLGMKELLNSLQRCRVGEQDKSVDMGCHVTLPY